MRALALLMLTSGAGWAQSQEQPPLFKAGTALVRVDVQVLDRGKPLTGLTASDFVVREEGEPKAIEYFGRDSEPLEIMLLLDVSGSMGKVLREMATAAQEALKRLKPEDKVGVALFARTAKVELELTNDRPAAVRVLRDSSFERGLGGGTSINDAVLQTARWWKEQPAFAGRRAIVILTDNGGMHFRSPDEAVIHALSDLNVTLNAIVPSGAKPPAELPRSGNVNPDFTPANVFRLAEASGGEVLRADGAGARFEEMMERVRLRYGLGIKPGGGERGVFRRLEVTLSDEARRRYPRAEIRARAGYYAP